MYTIHTRAELLTGAETVCLGGAMPQGEANAREWIVDVTRRGLPVDLDGYDIVCHVLLPDGTAGAQIAGTAERGRARVTLSADCSAMPGETRLTLRAVKGTAERAALAVLRYWVE